MRIYARSRYSGLRYVLERPTLQFGCVRPLRRFMQLVSASSFHIHLYHTTAHDPTHRVTSFNRKYFFQFVLSIAHILVCNKFYAISAIITNKYIKRNTFFRGHYF